MLIWVQKDDEAQITQAFEKTLAVRKLNAEARELADMYFFETLVRIHRAGEGAPYTGLKPAGTDFGPSIPASDKTLASGDIEPVLKLLSEKAEQAVPNLRHALRAIEDSSLLVTVLRNHKSG